MSALSKDIGITAHAVRPVSLPVSLSAHQPPRLLNVADEILLTAEVIEANRDRAGRCALLDNLDSPSAAIQRGPAPATLSRLAPGSFEAAEAREARRQAAHRLEDPAEKARALADVVATFGREQTSKTLMVIGESR